MHLYLRNIAWDTGNESPNVLGLPDHIIVLDAPRDDDDYLELVADEISEIYGYCHEGFDVGILEPDTKECRHEWYLNGTAIMKAPTTIELNLSAVTKEGN